MLLSTRCKLANEDTLHLHILNHPLVVVLCQKEFGIHIDDSLKWTEEICKTYSKLASRTSLL